MASSSWRGRPGMAAVGMTPQAMLGGGPGINWPLPLTVFYQPILAMTSAAWP